MTTTATPTRRVFAAGRLGPTTAGRRRALSARTDELIEAIRIGGRDTAANIDELIHIRREMLELDVQEVAPCS